MCLNTDSSNDFHLTTSYNIWTIIHLAVVLRQKFYFKNLLKMVNDKRKLWKKTTKQRQRRRQTERERVGVRQRDRQTETKRDRERDWQAEKERTWYSMLQLFVSLFLDKQMGRNNTIPIYLSVLLFPERNGNT